MTAAILEVRDPKVTRQAAEEAADFFTKFYVFDEFGLRDLPALARGAKPGNDFGGGSF